MSLEIKTESLESLFTYYNNPGGTLDWPSIYTLPIWMQTWWEVFRSDYELFVRSIYKDGRLLGIAPLMIKSGEAFLIGSPDVCDYLDFITPAANKDEEEFFRVLLPYLKESGVEKLILNAQRPDAGVFKGHIAAEAEEPSCFVTRFSREDETFELNLASSWDDYLAGLTKKQRHEVRRKLRRLQDETGSHDYRVLENAAEVGSFIPEFIKLFMQNPEKEEFLTSQREQYFRNLLVATAKKDLARFGLLDIDGQTVAAVLYFNYRGRVYLYNSGYNYAYREMSAGLLSKLFCIRDSIERGRPIFDFLKGREVYKGRLGATAVPIYRVTVTIS